MFGPCACLISKVVAVAMALFGYVADVERKEAGSWSVG
jgi:hypothetical protein